MAEGTRGGVTGSEIADTLEAVFTYFEDTKRGDSQLLSAINTEASEWHGQIAGLRNAEQETVDRFFGQPSPKDIQAAVRANGITREQDGEEAYRLAEDRAISARTTDHSAYWPGKVVPTLMDYKEILQFDAYREQLDGVTHGPASRLIERIDAFDGASGATHLAGTSLKHLIGEHIDRTPRHPSETYVEPDGVRVDYLNAFAHTYSSHISWMPSTDMQTVTTSLPLGYGSGEHRVAVLAHEKAKLDAAFERGGINATTEVQFGETYGGDRIRVTMGMDDYTNRYIPTVEGKREIDTSVPGSNFSGSIHTVSVYPGYQPGKEAFYNGQDVLVSPSVMSSLNAGLTEGRLADAQAALQFLRDAGFIREGSENVPVSIDGSQSFTRISPTPPPVYP